MALVDLQSMKKPSFEEAKKLRIEVSDNCSKAIGDLVPIGSWALDDDHLIKEFSNWRAMFMRFFQSQFKPSEQRSVYYLSNFSIGQDSRIFFAIYLTSGELIGHIGLSNITETTAELDNIIRGRSGGHSDLMYFSEKALLNWAFQTLKLEKITAQVMSRNILALNLHDRFGFRIVESFPMRRRQISAEEILFERCEEIEATEKTVLHIIELKQKEFFDSIHVS